jgi:5'-deoxynucleotidase YfbR-like HD superfamily hydrolase
MSKQAINFSRQVFNKQKFSETVDTEFSQLVERQDETFFDVNLATVEDFFTIYGNLFLEIPKNGEVNSHEFLINESTEYINFVAQNDTLNSLLQEIAELRQENLDIRQQNLELIEQFSTGVISTERQVVTTGASLAGVSTTNISVGGTSGGGGSNY